MRGLWSCFAIAVVPFAVTGCSDPRQIELEEAVDAMAELTSQCRQDTEKAPAQHSQNCIKATELVHPNYHTERIEDSLLSHCFENSSDACEHYRGNLMFSQQSYWRAIAQSAANFGVPDGARISLYDHSELMEPYFAQCLDDHPDPPKPEPRERSEPKSDVWGEVPVETGPMETGPLENQHCIPLGGNRQRF